jgi:hypothetical protein
VAGRTVGLTIRRSVARVDVVVGADRGLSPSFVVAGFDAEALAPRAQTKEEPK